MPRAKSKNRYPAKVKADFAEDLKELKLAEKDIQKMLPAQVERIDQLYLQQKEWPLEIWRERYLDHPLVGVIARRLIWRFHNGDKVHEGLWQDGTISDRKGSPLDLPAGTKVTLWHPLDSKQDEILAWRLWLEEKQIRQPFKQAPPRDLSAHSGGRNDANLLEPVRRPCPQAASIQCARHSSRLEKQIAAHGR